MKQQRVEDDKKTSALGTIWFFLRHYRRRLALLVGLAVLIGYLETLVIAVLYPILNATLEIDGGLSSNPFFRALDYFAQLIPVDNLLIAYCILFILLVFMVFLSRLIYINLSARTVAKVATDFKIRVFQKFTESDYQFFVDNRQGDLLYMAKGAPDATGPTLQLLAISTVEIIMAVLVLALLISISWKATIGVVVLGAAYYYLTRYLALKVSYVAGDKMMVANQNENAVLNEYISGTKQIIVARTGPRWQQLFQDAVVTRWQFWAKNTIWKKVPTYILELLLYASIGIIVIVIWALYPDDFYSLIPMFGTYAFAVFRLLPRLSNTGTALMQVMNSLPNLEATRKLLEDKTYNNIKNGTKEFSKFQSGIELRNIGFTYKNKDYVTLSDVSLRVEKNTLRCRQRRYTNRQC
jgi:ABC-type multidrug transport system fused ATPase/permease subunit